MRHKSKIDWWIGLSLLLGLIAPLVGAVPGKLVILYGVSALVCVVVFGFCFPRSHETTPAELLIRAGIPNWKITAVRPSSDSRSSLAMSLDRIESEYAGSAVLIAPEDQSAFIADTLTRCTRPSKRGQDLVRSVGGL